MRLAFRHAAICAETGHRGSREVFVFFQNSGVSMIKILNKILIRPSVPFFSAVL